MDHMETEMKAAEETIRARKEESERVTQSVRR